MAVVFRLSFLFFGILKISHWIGSSESYCLRRAAATMCNCTHQYCEKCRCHFSRRRNSLAWHIVYNESTIELLVLLLLLFSEAADAALVIVIVIIIISNLIKQNNTFSSVVWYARVCACVCLSLFIQFRYKNYETYQNKCNHRNVRAMAITIPASLLHITYVSEWVCRHSNKFFFCVFQPAFKQQS